MDALLPSFEIRFFSQFDKFIWTFFFNILLSFIVSTVLISSISIWLHVSIFFLFCCCNKICFAHDLLSFGSIIRYSVYRVIKSQTENNNISLLCFRLQIFFLGFCRYNFMYVSLFHDLLWHCFSFISLLFCDFVNKIRFKFVVCKKIPLIQRNILLLLTDFE